jgi:hypothetical protein
LYSSGLVAGKRSQKKDSEPARKATDANPVTHTPGCVRSCHFITPFFLFLKRKEYTPLVRSEEKTGKPITLQKM